MGFALKKPLFAFKCAIELKFILTLSGNHVSILNLCCRYITTANLSETPHYNLSHNFICISLKMYLQLVLMQPATTVIGPFITVVNLYVFLEKWKLLHLHSLYTRWKQYWPLAKFTLQNLQTCRSCICMHHHQGLAGKALMSPQKSLR